MFILKELSFKIFFLYSSANLTSHLSQRTHIIFYNFFLTLIYLIDCFWLLLLKFWQDSIGVVRFHVVSRNSGDQPVALEQRPIKGRMWWCGAVQNLVSQYHLGHPFGDLQTPSTSYHGLTLGESCGNSDWTNIIHFLGCIQTNELYSRLCEIDLFYKYYILK